MEITLLALHSFVGGIAFYVSLGDDIFVLKNIILADSILYLQST